MGGEQKGRWGEETEPEAGGEAAERQRLGRHPEEEETLRRPVCS